MRILLWHVHGSWTTAFVQGSHEYVVPVLPGRGPDGLGRARTWAWPASVSELNPEALAGTDFDVVILQRPIEIDLISRWLGRTPGTDIPAVYLEHNTPDRMPCSQRHPLADRTDIPIAHVTHFNELFWDNGSAPTTVIEHGIIDPGARYSGEIGAGAIVVNEPARRGRIVGADLLPRFATAGPLDVFGMQAASVAAWDEAGGDGVGGGRITGFEDLATQDQMHSQIARRRVYLHPMRWTSLGLSLIEAMQLAMPVIALATTEAGEAVPPDAGAVSTNVSRLVEAFRMFLNDPAAATECGARAREAGLRRYGLARFLADWDRLLTRTIQQR
jgi:hypothetical protein